MVFVDHKAEAQRPAGQGALLQVHGPDDGGLIDIDGPGIFLTVRRGGGAVQGIADAAGSGEFHGDALNAVEYPVLCEAYRLFRHGAAAAGIFFSRTGGGEVEPALLPLLPAVAGLIRDVPQGNKILQLPLTVGEIELLIAGVQTEAGAQGGLQQGLLLGAEHQPQLPRLQAQLRQAEFYRVIPVVRQAVVRQQHRLVGDVFQFHPVVIFAHLGQGGAIKDHHLVDRQGAVAAETLLESLIARRAVFIARRGVQALRIAAVGAQSHGHIPLAVAAEGRGDEGSMLIAQIDPLVPGEGKIGMQLLPLPVLAGGKKQQPLPRFQAGFRQSPPQLVLLVGYGPAGEGDRLPALIVQFDPVGEIPVPVPEGGSVLLHKLADHHLPQAPVPFLRAEGRRRRGRWRGRRGGLRRLLAANAEQGCGDQDRYPFYCFLAHFFSLSLDIKIQDIIPLFRPLVNAADY